MTPRPLTRRLGSGLVGLALLAGACLPDEEGPVREAKPEAEPGGSVTVGIAEPVSIDPGVAGDPAGELVTRTMCDPLVEADPVTGELRPAIAESWQVSDSGRRITVKLREGVRFHDGREVTAEDVVYTLSRVVRPETASPLSDLLEPISGYEPLREDDPTVERRFRESLRGVRAIERYSFEITLTREEAGFVRLLSHPLTSPVPEDTVEADPAAFERQPVCAGPYEVAEPWERDDDEIVLVRAADYDARNDAFTRGGAGYADRVVFRIHPDRQAEHDAFAAGELDVAHVSEEQRTRAEDAEGLRVEGFDPRLDYVGLPVNRPPLDTRAVRVALSQALDRRAIAEGVFAGARVPASGVLPPTVGPAYREDACDVNAPAEGDVASAQTTLEQAGAELDGVALPVAFNDEFDHRELVSAVAAQWEEALGVRTELVPMEWAEYLSRARSPQGFDGPFRMSWAAEYPSADRYLEPLLASSSIGANNFSRFNDRAFDQALARDARRATVAEDRHQAYERLEDLACGQMPIIPVTFGVSTYLVDDEKLDSAIDEMLDRSTAQPLLRELFVR